MSVFAQLLADYTACLQDHDYRDASIARNALIAEYQALQTRLEQAEKDSARYVKVDRAVFQMVLNALERDANEGKKSRGEMREELLNSSKF